MTENRLFAGWLRSLTGLVAVAGVLALSACGGGSGAPNNVFKSTLTVLPSTVTVYAGVPTLLTISGGTGPFKAFSSNPAVLPVAENVSGRQILLLANNLATDADVADTITVQDLGPLSPVAPRRRSPSPCARRPSSTHSRSRRIWLAPPQGPPPPCVPGKPPWRR